MKTNFSLLFYLKRQKNYQSGPVAIYMRITVNGKRVEMTSGRSCEPSQWNTVNGRSSGKKEDSKSLNAYLDDLQFKIHEAHRQLTLHNEEVTAISIRDRFLGKQGSHHTIIGVFKEHNRKLEILIGSEYTKGTAERYRTSLKHTIDFLQWKYSAADMDLGPVFIIYYAVKNSALCKNIFGENGSIHSDLSLDITAFGKSKMKSAKEKHTGSFLYDIKTEKIIEVYVMPWSELVQ